MNLIQHKLIKSGSCDIIRNNNTSQQYMENMDNSFKPNLDFYACGNVNKYPDKNIIKLNNSYGGGANNLLNRNYLSVNNPYFDKLKSTIPKKLFTIFHQIPNENNYLEPFEPYKNEHRYDIPDYGINHEMYDIMKKKLYIKDDKSNVYKGKQITEDDFINSKNKIININTNQKTNLSPTARTIRGKFHDKIKKFINPNNIKEIIREENENNCDDIVKEKYGIKKLVNSNSANIFQPKNPMNEHHKELKSINNHFNINNTHVFKSRNWWIQE